MSALIVPLVSTFDAYDSKAKAAALAMQAQLQADGAAATAQLGALDTLLVQTLSAQANVSAGLAATRLVMQAGLKTLREAVEIVTLASSLALQGQSIESPWVHPLIAFPTGIPVPTHPKALVLLGV